MSEKLKLSIQGILGHEILNKSGELYFIRAYLENEGYSGSYEIKIPIPKESYDNLRKQIESSKNAMARVVLAGELEMKVLEPTIN